MPKKHELHSACSASVGVGHCSTYLVEIFHSMKKTRAGPSGSGKTTIGACCHVCRLVWGPLWWMSQRQATSNAQMPGQTAGAKMH